MGHSAGCKTAQKADAKADVRAEYVPWAGVLRQLQKDDGASQCTHGEGGAQQFQVLHV